MHHISNIFMYDIHVFWVGGKMRWTEWVLTVEFCNSSEIYPKSVLVHIISWAEVITAKHISAENGGHFIYDINNNSIDIEKVPNGKRATYFSARKRGHSLTKWLLSAQVKEAKLTVNRGNSECLQPYDIKLIIAYEWWVERPLCIKSDMWLFSSEKVCKLERDNWGQKH